MKMTGWSGDVEDAFLYLRLKRLKWRGCFLVAKVSLLLVKRGRNS
jgi:hypothetical protein